jgi:alginate O-acetyltransferase complex protein AlgJ
MLTTGLINIMDGLNSELPFQWWLDSPRNGRNFAENEKIEIRGWVLAPETVLILVRTTDDNRTYPLNYTRHDVIESKLPAMSGNEDVAKCGFIYDFDSNIKHIEFGVRFAQKDFWLCRIDLKSRAEVLEGKSGWLFLDNDTNRSVDQFRGNFLLSNETIEAWSNYFSAADEVEKKIGAKYCYLIAPAKEEIFFDYYPFQRARKTPIDQFLQAFGKRENLVFPRQELAEARDLTYYRVDTHWSDYGAYIAAVQVLKNFRLEAYIPFLNSSFKIANVKGDLGEKTVPQRLSARLISDQSLSKSKKLFSNRINNVGKIWIYENDSAKLNTTLMIFGDSFSTNLCGFLSEIFQRLIYVHSVAAWDNEMIQQEMPSHILLQTNQRFIVRAPDASFGIWRFVRMKLSKMNEYEVIKLKNELMADTVHEAKYYVTQMILAIDERLKGFI